MNIEIVNEEKNEIELKIDNLTVAEVLRVYLYKSGVEFAAWKREHPSKPLIFKIKSSNAKKNISDAVAAIKKDCDKIASLVKK
ncbi:MAG: RpoL/Rpb11 RNA polymerase subunit family protein [Nanoarchaeota archaeon]|nr:RpoL/Rpb11 RNA polymerase subunit family protein [Nanoarchaeota archaeon]